MSTAPPGLEQYQEIIDNLKSSIRSANFESQLKSEAMDLSRAELFLLKTELQRLGRTSQSAIDLREMVEGDIDPFEHNGLVHYLNLEARTAFENAIAEYGDYTAGVYEEVMATVQGGGGKSGSKDGNKEKKEELGTPVKAIHFNRFHHRDEERMNFSSQVELIQQVTENIQAVTIDISMSGLRIKMSKKSLLNISEKIPVIFLGLEQDYSIGLKTPIQYRVVSVETIGDDKRVALKRTFVEKDDIFEKFLHRFINGNKKRYRINLDNTLEAVTAKTYEQFYLPRMMTLPLFAGQRMNQEFCVQFAMLNDNNRGFYQFWKDEVGNNQLNHILNSRRLSFLLKKASEGVYECLLYSFNQVNKGKTMFFAALDAELLQEPKLYQQFLSYGAKKDSFSIIKLEAVAVDPKQSYQPLSMPDDVSESVKKANKPPTPRLMAHIKDLKLMVLMTDVTTDNGIHNYARLPFDAKSADFLRKLVCKQGKHQTYIESVRFKYQNLRSEDRYFFKTPITLDTEGFDQTGVTVDFSAKGIKVEFESQYPFDIGSYTNVRFPSLQQLTEKLGIRNLFYRVVHINGDRTAVSLQISEDQKKLTKALFSELLQSNRNRMKINGEQQELAGLDDALRNIYSTNLVHYPFFVQKDGADVNPSFMALPSMEHDLTHMFRLGTENEQQLNIHALTQSKISGVDFIETMLRKMERSSRPVYRELLIKVVPTAEHLNDIYLAKFTDEFPADKDRVNFIKRAMSQGVFFALRVYLSRTVRPDTDFISVEMNYINHYAQHRAKVLEEEIWQVLGVGEVIDVTREVLLRYRFTPKQVTEHLANRALAFSAEKNEDSEQQED